MTIKETMMDETDRPAIETMTDREVMAEILETMRSVATGLNEATTKLQSHPMLKVLFK